MELVPSMVAMAIPVAEDCKMFYVFSFTAYIYPYAVHITRVEIVP